MFNFEIIEIDNEKWNHVLKASYIYDFHHTPYYHKIDNHFKSVLLLASDGNDFIGFPLVIRPIEGTEWKDLTSVYGYCGPVSNRDNLGFLSNLGFFFKEKFNDFCKDNKIVSAFSRLHPLIRQEPLFGEFGEVVHLNKTVSIDLRLSPAEQRQKYRKSNKSEINQLRRRGYSVEEAVKDKEIDRFIEIYSETMDRVHASPQYYFEKDYFYSFIKNSYFESKLLLAKFEDSIIAGAIFTVTDKIMQYHLAGTTEAYIRQTPMKLILDEARLLGDELGLDYLHLGGGVGGSDEDSLFRFKSGFSKDFKQFSVWKYVVNQEIYDQLSEGRSGSDYFPFYRQR